MMSESELLDGRWEVEQAWGQQIMRTLVLSTRFSCEPTAALKNKVYFKKESSGKDAT